MAADHLQLGSLDGPLLIFGGPYSNLQATEALQQRAAQLNIPPERIICTGDIIAYCGDPEATLELIRDWGIEVVRGNCEESLGSGAADCGCGFDAGTTCSLLSVDWYRFALGRLDAGQRSWMRERPVRIDLEVAGRSIAIVHGGLRQINRFIFASTPVEIKEQELDLAGTDIVIGGHCGLPFGQQLGERAWLNSGAIGLPANDGTRDGWYLLLETEGTAVRASWQRLEYDAERAAAIMQQAGLTDAYRCTLLNGLWPSMDVLPEMERSNRGVALAVEGLEL